MRVEGQRANATCAAPAWIGIQRICQLGRMRQVQWLRMALKHCNDHNLCNLSAPQEILDQRLQALAYLILANLYFKMQMPDEAENAARLEIQDHP